MKIGNQGTAFLPDGCLLPRGPYPVFCELETNEQGAATGEVHFYCEPQHARPIALGIEFDLHVQNPDAMMADDVVLRLTFSDDLGTVAGYILGSKAQFISATKQSGGGGRVAMNTDVFVIHGRDERLRSAMFTFLRSLGLNPMEWSQAIELTGKGAPYVGEVLDAAFSHAQAVVVLLTPDDLARLRPELLGNAEPDHERNLSPQARPNVLFEAGMAMARQPERTIMVEIGALRPFSDVGGRHTIRMDNSAKKRNELASRLKSAGCPVNLAGTDWQTHGDLTPPELRITTQRVPETHQTSSEARELLVAASEDPNGRVMCVMTMEGLAVSTNNRGFGESENARSQARWKKAVRELIDTGWLEPLDEDQEVLTLTDEGYSAAEKIKASHPRIATATDPRPLVLSLSLTGKPPSQKIKLTANAAVKTTGVEYMLSNEACIASEEVSLQGDSMEIPINHDLVRKVWNVPRSDRNHYDHSGPAKLAVTAIANGRVRQFVLPIQMENAIINNTSYANLVGSKTFHEG